MFRFKCDPPQTMCLNVLESSGADDLIQEVNVALLRLAPPGESRLMAVCSGAGRLGAGGWGQGVVAPPLLSPPSGLDPIVWVSAVFQAEKACTSDPQFLRAPGGTEPGFGTEPQKRKDWRGAWWSHQAPGVRTRPRPQGPAGGVHSRCEKGCCS